MEADAVGRWKKLAYDSVIKDIYFKSSAGHLRQEGYNKF